MYVNKHLALVDMCGLVFLSLTLTYVVFHQLDPRGLAIVGTLLIIGEMFAQTRWRTSMICRNCGFDPVVYVRSPEKAGLKIKAFLDHRADSPEHLLKPPVILPVKKQPKGQNLSLKI